MKNVNRDYLVTVDAKTAKITPPKDMKFFITDILTCNIFFQLEISDTNSSFTGAPNEDASNYTLTLRVLKPNNTTKEKIAKFMYQSGNHFYYIADLDPEFTNIIGYCECELFIETEVTKEDGSKQHEINTTDSFEYEVVKSIFTEVGEIIEGDPDYPGILDSFATRDYVTNAIKNMDLLGFATRDYVTQVIVGGGVDLSEYVTDTELSGVLNNYVTNYVFNNALNNKSDKSHTHDNYATTTYVNDVVSNINLDGYVTDEEMAQALIDFAGSGSIDLSSYVTEKELQEALSNFSGGGDVDLSGYVTDTELNTALSNKADKSHTHDSYATKTYVHDVIANADLDNYVTDEELSNILANMPDNTYDDTELRGLIAAKADGTHSHSEYIVADAVDGVWVGTQDEYNAIIHIDPNILYFIQEDGI